MPVLPFIGALSFYISFWVDKYLFCNFYRIPPKYSDDIDDVLFDYKCYRKAVYRPKQKKNQVDQRTDLITFNPQMHEDELNQIFRIWLIGGALCVKGALWRLPV